MRFVYLVAVLLAGAVYGCAAEAPDYRTDASTDEKLPWFQLKAGEFPPADAAHYIGGELISVDHINRAGALRQDRTDAIRRGDWDHSLPFTMLPFGSIWYHGAPAELRDIPVGTHLHGEFFVDEKAPKGNKEVFSRVARLEDDFSYQMRQGRCWQVVSVDPEKSTVTVTKALPPADRSHMTENVFIGLARGYLVEAKAPDNAVESKPVTYQLAPTTRFWKGHGFGYVSDLTPGRAIQINLTVCTLKGPGRCTDIWLDAESIALAQSMQTAVHRQYAHEHGLAGWIDAVDNQQGTITATLFPGFDPALLEDFVIGQGVTTAVAVESLRTYDQINDKIAGSILELQKKPGWDGGTAVEIKFKPNNLLEGFRPKRFVRLFSGKWKVDDLPKEERLDE